MEIAGPEGHLVEGEKLNLREVANLSSIRSNTVSCSKLATILWFFTETTSFWKSEAIIKRREVIFKGLSVICHLDLESFLET